MSETFDHLIIDALSSHIAIVDQAGTVVAVNRAWRQFAQANGATDADTGVGINYLAKCRMAEGEFAPLAHAAAAGIDGVLTGAQSNFVMEYPCHSPKSSRWFQMQVTPLSAFPRRVIVQHHNITERKVAEEALEREHNLLRTVIDHLPDFIFAKDTNQRFTLVNQAYANYLGAASPDMVRGKTVFDFFPPDLAEVYQKDDLVVLTTGRTLANYEVPSLDRAGNRRLHLTTKCPLVDEQGKVSGLVGIGHDITERKAAEEEKNRLLAAITQQRTRLRALSKRLAENQERERKELARELHDQVGQNLTAIGLALKLAQTQSSMAPTVGGQLKTQMQSALTLVTQTTEAIRHLMTELRPAVLDDYGLVAALRWYGEQVVMRSGLRIHVYGVPLMPRLPELVENALFRIAQEAINNTLKHGQATEVAITVNETDDHVSLTISDNGQGFDPQAATITQSGWGLLNMRERAEAVEGRCHVISQPGAGVSVIVEVPR